MDGNTALCFSVGADGIADPVWERNACCNRL